MNLLNRYKVYSASKVNNFIFYFVFWILTNSVVRAMYILCCRLACKEIDIGWTGSNLVSKIPFDKKKLSFFMNVELILDWNLPQRTLEILLIIVSGTQLFCTAAINMGVDDATKRDIWFLYSQIVCHSLVCSFILDGVEVCLPILFYFERVYIGMLNSTNEKKCDLVSFDLL